MSTNRKEIKTEQGIDKVIKVKYKITRDISEYKKALHYLEELKKYHSVTAEKKRVFKMEEKIKLILNPSETIKYDEDGKYIDTFLIEAKIKFENLVRSYVNFINPKYLEDDEYRKAKYFVSKQDNNINENLDYIPNNKFKVKYIIDDVIYIDSFELKYKKFKGKIIVTKTIKAPFPLEYFSYRSTLAKWNFKRKFKYYISDIKTGLK